jgi:hypothetical protein
MLNEPTRNTSGKILGGRLKSRIKRSFKELLMDEQPTSQENVTDELKQLGQNLLTFLKTAWESQESKKIQQEIQAGVNELGQSLKTEFDNLANSSAGQKIKTDFQEFQEKVSTGEIEAKFRSDLSTSLRTINREIQKITEQLINNESGPTAPHQEEEINHTKE